MQIDETDVRALNPAVYAMRRLQEQMKGAADEAGFLSEEDVVGWITQLRREKTTS